MIYIFFTPLRFTWSRISIRLQVRSYFYLGGRECSCVHGNAQRKINFADFKRSMLLTFHTSGWKMCKFTPALFWIAEKLGNWKTSKQPHRSIQVIGDAQTEADEFCSKRDAFEHKGTLAWTFQMQIFIIVAGTAVFNASFWWCGSF